MTITWSIAYVHKHHHLILNEKRSVISTATYFDNGLFFCRVVQIMWYSIIVSVDGDNLALHTTWIFASLSWSVAWCLSSSSIVAQRKSNYQSRDSNEQQSRLKATKFKNPSAKLQYRWGVATGRHKVWLVNQLICKASASTGRMMHSFRSRSVAEISPVLSALKCGLRTFSLWQIHSWAAKIIIHRQHNDIFARNNAQNLFFTGSALHEPKNPSHRIRLLLQTYILPL